MTTTTLNPTLGNHIMDTATYQNSSFDGFATPSIGLNVGITRLAVLKFSLPSATTLATATLSIMAKSSTSSQTYYTWRTLRNVTNTVTWLTYDGSNFWAQGGATGTGDVDSTALGSVTTGVSANTFFDISLNTTEILKMMDGTYTNYGFIVSSNGGTVLTYYNYNYATVGNRPKLFLDYGTGVVSTIYPKIMWI